jgi:NAD(P)-dependent dehydrogenase (short-subunit alcohol dehydrogenase family)
MSSTIFITGSSTGLGRATAQLFAARGWNVIATMRSPHKEAELGALPGVTLVALDVRRLDQIDSAVRQALGLGPVDVVFNNAGYALSGPFEGATDDQIVAEIETNLLGAMRVAHAFIPALRERGSGTIITTSSIGGHITYPLNSVYHATKWALEGFSESLAFELAPFGVRVKTVAPGGIRTDFTGRSLVLTQHPAYAALLERVTAVFMDPKRRAEGSTPEQIAETVYEAATDGSDRVTYLAGEDAKRSLAQRVAVGAESFRKAVAKAFFG